MLTEFESFSEAFRHIPDKKGVDHVDVYTRVPMDKGQFSKVYSGKIKSPAGDEAYRPKSDSFEATLVPITGAILLSSSLSWIAHQPRHLYLDPDNLDAI